MEIIDQLHRNYLFAVIRGKDCQDAVEIAKASINGGIKNIEITFTTPEAEKVIELVSKAKYDNVIIGAGTVMNLENARLAVQAGAQFIVSPHFSTQIATFCSESSIPYIPGCGTMTEICNALEYGIEVIKIFPGRILGPEFIEDVHGPLPNVPLMPSGGVSLENMHKWYYSGAWAVGIGGALTQDIEVQGYESVSHNARQFFNHYQELIQEDRN